MTGRVRPHRTLILAVSLLAAGWSAGCIEDPLECTTMALDVYWERPGAWDTFPTTDQHNGFNLSDLSQIGLSFDDPEWGELRLRAIEWRPHKTEMAPGPERTYSLRFDTQSNRSVGLLETELPDDRGDDRIGNDLSLFFQNLTQAPGDKQDTWTRSFLANRTMVPQTPPPTESGQPPPEPAASGTDSFHAEIPGPFLAEALYEKMLNRSSIDDRPFPWGSPVRPDEGWSYRFDTPRRIAASQDEPSVRLIVSPLDKLQFRSTESLPIEIWEQRLNMTLLAFDLAPLPADKAATLGYSHCR